MPTASKKPRARRAVKRAKRSTSRRRKADPTRLTAAEAARLLKVPVDVIKRHLQAGAPAEPGRRINLVHYAAWLLQQSDHAR